ncbi:AB hydrolase superfamily protein B1A11.02 [Trametes pubescens]|uniref:AB hydrolase superfamily protein B1A11.02 n=1 Tax=Trametes pubescens TaxID=154538 RepID=A0A1M2W0T5_TRAPU|nr:AB hydrolase superfamily protein B1A11.02 [Trametes pubescens]
MSTNAQQTEGPTPAPTLQIAEARAFFKEWLTIPFKAYSVQHLPSETTYTVRDEIIAVDDGSFSVRCIVPVGDDEHETFPVLVYIHGGGWSSGDVELDDYHLRKVAVDLKLSIVNVNYRLAPEHPFPTAVNDGLAALKWIVSNAPLLKANLSKGFIISGHSAGANLSTVLSHEARDDPFFRGPGRQLTGQLLREPMVIHPDFHPEELKAELRSIEEHPPPPVVRAVMEFYNPDPLDPRFSPLLYPSHVGVPRAYVQGMGLDSFRDDARVYVKALRQAGVESKYTEYPGVSHGFHYSTPETEIAVKVRADLEEGLKWLLGRESSL